MARMYPDRPLPGTKSDAERTVFFALKELLPQEYIVMHSVPVYRRDTHASRLKDGEADFVIIHPDKGMLVIEVKGGEIKREQETGKWFSIGFNGLNEIKDPYDQAKSNVYDLAYDLSRERTTRKHSFSYGHAVWFPNVDVAKSDLKLSSSIRGITLGKDEVDNAASAIPRLFKNALGETPAPCGPGDDGAQAIVDFLYPSLELSFSLSSALRDQEKQIALATQSQFRVLSHLKRHKKALICGPAGSGKTFLAMEKAKRIMESNPAAKILITCFNVNLAFMIREALSPLGEGVEVFHFHGLCSEVCKRAHVPFPKKDPLASDARYFEEVLPSAMIDALDFYAGRYDAIIVDEGQDFKASWWLPLQCLLEDYEDGVLYIFYDDNQSIYRDGAKNFPVKDEPIALSENCRNTKQICDYVNKFYSGDPPEPLGPDGPSPKIVSVGSEQGEEGALKELLDELIAKQGYKADDIVILTKFSKDRSTIYNLRKIGHYKIKWYEPSMAKTVDCITMCNVFSFKGLESKVIILVESDNIATRDDANLMYVASSRAKCCLAIIN